MFVENNLTTRLGTASLGTPHVAHTLVLGVGNILQQDDGLGVRVAEMLANHRLPEGVCVRDAGTPGIGLVTQMEDWACVYIIDAAEMGETPGAWRRFTPAEVRLIAEDGAISAHEADVASALALAEAVGVLPDEVILYAVEPQKVGWGEGLSAPVTTALPGLVDQILEELWKREA
jgi:hydrogenase maturation protease